MRICWLNSEAVLVSVQCMHSSYLQQQQAGSFHRNMLWHKLFGMFRHDSAFLNVWDQIFLSVNLSRFVAFVLPCQKSTLIDCVLVQSSVCNTSDELSLKLDNHFSYAMQGTNS